MSLTLTVALAVVAALLLFGLVVSVKVRNTPGRIQRAAEAQRERAESADDGEGPTGDRSA